MIVLGTCLLLILHCVCFLCFIYLPALGLSCDRQDFRSLLWHVRSSSRPGVAPGPMHWACGIFSPWTARKVQFLSPVLAQYS